MNDYDCRQHCTRAASFTVLLIILWLAVHILRESEYLYLLYNSAVVGGLLSGSLHALTGSDHLAALLPLIFGKRWWISCSHGIVWGLGHGFTSSAIGLLSYSMKNYLLNSTMAFEMYGYVVDGAVGVTLIIIGIMGFYEGGAEHDNTAQNSAEPSQSRIEDASPSTNTFLEQQTSTVDGTGVSGAAAAKSGAATSWSARILTVTSVFVNGCVLGVSWDGLPSLAPSMVLEGWPLTRFLLFYALGTAATMCFAAGLVGETTCWISRVAKVNVSERLASVSSACAIIIGALWTLSGVIKCLDQHYHVHHQDGIYNSAYNVVDGVDATSVVANDNFATGINSNDNFQEHAYGVGVNVALSCGSVAAVLGVIVYTTQWELGACTRSIVGKSAIHTV